MNPNLNRFLEIDSGAWLGLEETAGSSSATHHVGPVRFTIYSFSFVRILRIGDFDIQMEEEC